MKTRLILLALLAGASAIAQKVSTEFDDNADFSKYHTYRWRAQKINSRDPILNSPLVKQRIVSEIDKQMAGKGFEQVTNGKGDLIVGFVYGSGIQHEVNTYPAGWRGYGTRVVRTTKDKGTLFINLSDAGTGQLIWRAVCIDTESTVPKLEEHLPKDIKKALDQYPPKKK
jgi:hypothetical protein